MVPPVNFGAAPLLREDSLRSGDPLRATAGNASPGMFRDIANTHAQKKKICPATSPLPLLNNRISRRIQYTKNAATFLRIYSKKHEHMT